MKALNVQIDDKLFALLRKTAFDLEVPMRALVEGLLDDGLRTRKAKALATLAGGKTLPQGRPSIPPPTEGEAVKEQTREEHARAARDERIRHAAENHKRGKEPWE